MELGLQVADELQDLGLNRHVERRRRLVRDQQRRTAHQRHRDHRALAQPPRELERVAVEGLDGMREPDHVEHLRREAARLGAGHVAVQAHRFADLIPDRVQRRERGHRLLEDHRDPAAADLPHGGAVGVEGRDVDALRVLRVRPEADCACADPRHGRQDPHHRLRDHRLSGPRFADQGDRLAVRDPKRDPVHRAQHPLAVEPELHPQIRDLEDVAAHAGFLAPDVQCRYRNDPRPAPRSTPGRRSRNLTRTVRTSRRSALMPDRRYSALRPPFRGLRGSHESLDQAPLQGAMPRSTRDRPAH